MLKRKASKAKLKGQAAAAEGEAGAGAGDGAETNSNAGDARGADPTRNYDGLVVGGQHDDSKRRTFTFDYVFPQATAQEFVYGRAVDRVVGFFVDGINVTVFAYGQTGSGKTHTMFGIKETPDAGIQPRATS